MPGADGFDLLNWIRRDPESPLPFVSFALLTARADADVVSQSRDFGANEFIAKPFSADSVASRILSVISTPRQFVYTKHYFGPDRRRRSVEGVDPERRVKKTEDTEVFHSQRAPSSLDMKEGRVCFFRLKNSLKERLSGGTGGGEIDPDALEAANEELANFAEDFAASAAEMLVKLERTLNRIVNTGEDIEDHIRTINECAHELRGQGGIFGFPLMTAFAKSLYECTITVQPATPMLLTIYKAHIDGMKVVLREEIEGAGGEIGAALLKSLEMAKQQHYAPK
jgi:response regulator RpfG family c-di-GMP phosphodiesterase